MTNNLVIRHLPAVLTFEEKKELLTHFGAKKVWCSSTNKTAVFAAFQSHEEAKASLFRLHQLKIGNRRLVVEFAYGNHEPDKHFKVDKVSSSNKPLKQFLIKLNAWNDSVNFYQPPSPHLKYKYPEPDKIILMNILKALCSHKPFYIQVVHLMNKMCLDSPFTENKLADKKLLALLENLPKGPSFESEPPNDTESEISSEEESKVTQILMCQPLKRKSTLPATRKRPGAVLACSTLPKVKKQLNDPDIFEKSIIADSKKINVNIPKTLVTNSNNDKLESVREINLSESLASSGNNFECLTKKDLLDNKLSFEDMKSIPVFKNYLPGNPTKKLYIKNLAKSTTENDLLRIYKRFVDDNQGDNFDIRLMQEGRMKGQAFVTFPSKELAEMALNESNGFILNDKPMVVHFAKMT